MGFMVTIEKFLSLPPKVHGGYERFFIATTNNTSYSKLVIWVNEKLSVNKAFQCSASRFTEYFVYQKEMKRICSPKKTNSLSHNQRSVGKSYGKQKKKLETSFSEGASFL